jgi:hypothetical protein
MHSNNTLQSRKFNANFGAAAATVQGSAFRQSDWNRVGITLVLGAAATGPIQVTLEHADDDGAGSPDTFGLAASLPVVTVPLAEVNAIGAVVDVQIPLKEYSELKLWLRPRVAATAGTVNVTGIVHLQGAQRPEQCQKAGDAELFDSITALQAPISYELLGSGQPVSEQVSTQKTA